MDRKSPKSARVAVVWRGDADARRSASGPASRFAAVFTALADAGFAPEPCVYREEAGDDVRAQLMGCQAAIVWVNPIQDGLRRLSLDDLLRDAAAAGVLVSAHPDVIAKIGVKAVLWRTRELGWGSDARLYATPEAFAAEFPGALANGPRVLKQNRGNGGQGVWKVTLAGEGHVIVQEAAGDGAERALPLAAFVAERRADFAGDGLIDQAFQPRLHDGMVRCYMSGERLAGFGWQKVRALMPPGSSPAEPRTYSGPDDARFQRLRGLMERQWTPQLCRIVGVAPEELPVIWDADFLLGPRDAAGYDSYVLCEINASSVFPIPDEAPAAIAATLRSRLAARATGRSSR